ncbi:MAG: hypothetical protein EHM47_09080 [Ignavibacteriales bacterium]|nr:MAG: hypothetical protein EHM47_09080 [Ignavibacteriales bacterium]
MDKNMLAVSIFPVEVNGSIKDPLESARELDIITDKSFYDLVDEFKIKLSVKNNLLRDVKIINDNCRMPVFILEKKIDEYWERVYLSDNFGIPVRSISQTEVVSGGSYDFEINIYSSEILDDDINGYYRLRFNLIDKESSKRLPEKYLYSNVFNIGGGL